VTGSANTQYHGVFSSLFIIYPQRTRQQEPEPWLSTVSVSHPSDRLMKSTS